MTTYVALLRGVNVGGRIIKMADLKLCFEKAGFQNVRTVLQTGNVIFESERDVDDLRPKIEKLLEDTYKYPAKAQVLPVDALREIIAANPFADAPENYQQYVIFFDGGLERDFVNETNGLDKEEVSAGKGVAYWKVEKGMTLKSSRGMLLSKPKYRTANTNRNTKTLKRIVSLVG